VSLGNGPQHRLQEGLTLTKSTPTIINKTTEAATGATGNSPQGAHHQRLPHLRWWSLSDPPVATHRGPPSTSSSTLVVATVRHARKRPQGARNRRLPHLRWCPPPHPLVAPPGPRHRCLLQLWWWPLPHPSAVTPRGAHHWHLLHLQWWSLPDPPIASPRGPTMDVLH
jgi:hypothetical protein